MNKETVKTTKEELNNQKSSELESRVIEIKRVARVVAGGRRFRFRATVVVGDSQGRVGIGVAKANDVTTAINKANYCAEKNIIKVPRKGQTIPYYVEATFGSAHILLRPASPGTGIIAGGPVRAVLEAAGIHDILSKVLGSHNKINNVKATFKALKMLKELVEKDKSIKKDKINKIKKGKE